MKNFVVLIILGLMLALIAFGLVPPVPSVPRVPRVPTVPLTTIRAAPSVHELTAADVETFLDGIVPLQLVRVASALPNREDVAGAIVAVESIGLFPAGSLTSSAADMSKFMLAHLQDGRLGTAQILKPETTRLMHSRAFASDPAANGMAYGFYEESRNGQRIISSRVSSGF